MADIDPIPRIRVSLVRDIPSGAVRVFGPGPWSNFYRFRSCYGLARVPAAEGDGEWEYEDRISVAGMQHDFYHDEGHRPSVTRCTVRYMTRYECQETYWTVLTGQPDPALKYHKPRATIPQIVRELKGKVLACTCPFPASGERDWCHAACLAWLARTHCYAELCCVDSHAATAVANEADRQGTSRAIAVASRVLISYCDKRYPLDIAGWAADNGHADDESAAALIGGL